MQRRAPAAAVCADTTTDRLTPRIAESPPPPPAQNRTTTFVSNTPLIGEGRDGDVGTTQEKLQRQSSLAYNKCIGVEQ